MKNNFAYIDLMIAACQKISQYTSGLDSSSFLQESIVQSAVIMQLQVLGEIAKKIDEATRQEISAPWSMIIGLRNVIAHEYFALDLTSLWNTVSIDIPILEKELHKYLHIHDLVYMPPFGDTRPLLEM